MEKRSRRLHIYRLLCAIIALILYNIMHFVFSFSLLVNNVLFFFLFVLLNAAFWASVSDCMLKVKIYQLPHFTTTIIIIIRSRLLLIPTSRVKQFTNNSWMQCIYTGTHINNVNALYVTIVHIMCIHITNICPCIGIWAYKTFLNITHETCINMYVYRYFVYTSSYGKWVWGWLLECIYKHFFTFFNLFIKTPH